MIKLKTGYSKSRVYYISILTLSRLNELIFNHSCRKFVSICAFNRNHVFTLPRAVHRLNHNCTNNKILRCIICIFKKLILLPLYWRAYPCK